MTLTQNHYRHYFITATNTDAGKTYVASYLAQQLRNAGHDVAVMKPVASGCYLSSSGLRNPDTDALIDASGCTADYDIINPYRFQPAIAPHIAAQQADINISLGTIQNCYQQLITNADYSIVEGAGGWFVPLNEAQLMSEIPQALNLAVILVVDIKLGCINHALLSWEAIKRSGCEFAGWIANQTEPHVDNKEEIFAYLCQSLGQPLENLNHKK